MNEEEAVAIATKHARCQKSRDLKKEQKEKLTEDELTSLAIDYILGTYTYSERGYGKQ